MSDNAIALPHVKRRRPFGPRERRALMWVCVGVLCICFDFYFVAGDMARSHFDFWTVFDVVIIVVWGRVIIPTEWKIIRAWLDSEGSS